jgi:hypothetical protein
MLVKGKFSFAKTHCSSACGASYVSFVLPPSRRHDDRLDLRTAFSTGAPLERMQRHDLIHATLWTRINSSHCAGSGPGSGMRSSLVSGDADALFVSDEPE